jgi:hypothetical protein
MAVVLKTLKNAMTLRRSDQIRVFLIPLVLENGSIDIEAGSRAIFIMGAGGATVAENFQGCMQGRVV